MENPERNTSLFSLSGLSLATVLIWSTLIAVLLTSVAAGILSVVSITTDVGKDKKERVNYDLVAVRKQFDDQKTRLAERFNLLAGDLAGMDAVDQTRMQEMKTELEFTLLNACDTGGTPVAGDYGADTYSVPLTDDPVIHQTLTGNAGRGTVLLSRQRLAKEGGELLTAALVEDIAAEEAGALFWWFAYPITNDAGELEGILYGGRSLNRNFPLVDDLRELVFGTRSYNGKPLGTVTIFLNDTRVATNVITNDGSRAVGTVVSDEVRQKVLERGEKWLDSAVVVDTRYVSAYEPLRNPDGKIIGMLYAGLLEAPYSDLVTGLITKLLIIIFSGSLITGLAAILITRRITAPLSQLSDEVHSFAQGERHEQTREIESYQEIKRLAAAFHQMEEAISRHERLLKQRNEELETVNDKLKRTNRNYMETLGFVTHELKSPLAAIQTMIDTVFMTAGDELDDQPRHFLGRIKHRCEELQDMVKNYLDLSRVERGELEPNIEEIEFMEDVVEPCEEQSMPMFKSRDVSLEINAPERVTLEADQDQLRIALNNFLSNAAKYGRKGGNARLEISTDDSRLHVRVWNEGEGFTKEEREKLFGKFNRLKNKNTRHQQGSGLGLFLTREIIRHHGGSVDAESEPGEWAAFSFTVPLRQNAES